MNGTPSAPHGAPQVRTTTVVVSGVSGTGKSTVARLLVERTGWDFAEGDDLHPAANRRKMTAGTPLDDADRLPWLRRIAAWVGTCEADGRNAVVTCSALRRSYRDLLRAGHPSVWFVQLTAGPEDLDRRLRTRRGHFMPASLLGSQLTTLEPLTPDEPGAVYPSDGGPLRVAERVLGDLRTRPGR
ncbi:carbohydrate kinase, thermoresistant glucokinase family [Pseudonocardia dioxanivorans CB1190]|uniref:Gluconokinase n=1 Tax=Pseudonocardia dioxanivorans (strain ATCC 55486 / DSM 44775 / JCM 13855 / CB1190) TaxID=675635 RepID=F4D088_PSEUX|nr:gluconokinase [Pseudonocardia dioxanivorans]AEA25744.1 carbohydrate kinase, thermoresistant glucokinase family [Pseudonocardia dioxanivorans CB1190]